MGTSMANKILFCDHSFHKFTKSSQGFVDLLKKSYDVDICYDESWLIPDKREEFEKSLKKCTLEKYDAIIFWQILPRSAVISSINCENKIWVPMFDDFSVHQFKTCYESRVKILSFSKHLHELACSFGISSFYSPILMPQLAQYQKDFYHGITVYFWQRRESPCWKTIKALLGEQVVKSVIYRIHIDPQDHEYEMSQPSPEDIEKYNIEIIRGWLSEQNHSNLLKRSQLYIASRFCEGIGFANLDAMSFGCVIVASDEPVTNEYVCDGVNGYLYKKENVEQIDLSKIQYLHDNMISGLLKNSENSETIKDRILNCIVDSSWFTQINKTKLIIKLCEINIKRIISKVSHKKNKIIKACHLMARN
jgi:hypothetical protein